MLESVAGGDWNGYASYCDPSLSCFEAETNGILAEGLAFRRFYFSDKDSNANINTNRKNCSVNVSMARPHLR